MELRLLSRACTREHRDGTAPTFDDALAGFKDDWTSLLPEVPQGALDEYRRNRAFHEWKYRMWEAGCRLPTQESSGSSRCFCGAEIGIACEEHVYARHMDPAE